MLKKILQKTHLLPIGGLTLIFLLFFRHWLQSGLITAGDWGFFWPETMLDWWPGWQLWDSGFNFGRVIDQFFVQFALKGMITQFFGLGYSFSERLLWFYPLLLLLIMSCYSLVYSLTKERLAAFFAALAFGLNTYMLMLAVGGQISIAVAISATPITLLYFIQAVETGKLSKQILTALCLSFVTLFDLRIGYIAMLMLILFVVIHTISKKNEAGYLKGLATAVKNTWWFLLMFALIQSYWLFPFMQGGGVELPTDFSQTDWIRKLSFMTLENAITMHHPLWPLRILGKIQETEPVFYVNVIVIIAGMALALKKNLKNWFYFLALLGIGALLLKGSHEPLGSWYLWAFKHVPGFFLFRDPSKFYLLVSVGFAFFFGISASSFVTKTAAFMQKKKNLPPHLTKILLIGVSIWFILYQTGPALIQDIGGTFLQKEVPMEYNILHNQLTKEEGFFRTFWVPQKQRFAFFTNEKPIINNLEEGAALYEMSSFNTTTLLTCTYYQDLINQPTMNIAAVKYIIIPEDSEHEFTQNNGQCSPNKIEGILKRKPWLTKKSETKHIKVFKNESYLPHLYTSVIPIVSLTNPAIMKNIESLDKTLWQYPTVLNIQKLTHEQRERVNQLPSIQMLQYDAANFNNVALNYGWEKPTTKIDTRANEFPNGRITYKISLPNQGTYRLFANLRHDSTRGTLKYVFDATNIKNVNDENIDQDISWSNGIKPYHPSTNPERDFFYQDVFLGETRLDKGEHTLTFRNSPPYDGNIQIPKKYGNMTIDYFWLVKMPQDKLERPEITWKRQSATHYTAIVNNAKNGFWLNFLEKYHPGWKLKINGQQLPEQKHFQSNIYGQSWYIDQTGNLTLDIVYTPQKNLEYGLFISSITLITNIILLIILYVQRKLSLFSTLQKRV